jgi:serine/threonine protein kinase
VTEERTIAGHRVLRLLGRGTRSSCWLAPRDLVLKVLDAPGAAVPAVEAEALRRARDEHVIELLDISVRADEVVLVHPRLPRGSLAALLSARPVLVAGEAVTILAPLAGALARMHEAGAAHGAVTADHVLFRADGAPVLIGTGAVTLFEPGLPEVSREQIEGVIHDRRGLATLAQAVLGRVSGSRAAAFANELRAAGDEDLEIRLGRGLFELAAARPVVFEAPPGDAGEVRAIGVHPVIEPEDPAPPALLTRVLSLGPAVIARERATAIWNGWPDTRRRLALGVAAAVLAILVALAAIPSPAPPAAPPQTEPAVSPTAVPSEVEAPEDPVEALSRLLARREECLRDLSMLCLEDVDEQGSAALDDDRRAIQAVIDAGEQPAAVDARDAAVVERLGDSVLIALGPESRPASVLLMKGEAGWRIRDYIARTG